MFFSQGYFSTAAVKYARNRPEKIKNLILLNPPVRNKKKTFRFLLFVRTNLEPVFQLTPEHAKLPSTLSVFSNFLLGEIFSQVGYIK